MTTDIIQQKSPSSQDKKKVKKRGRPLLNKTVGLINRFSSK
jgi:hypothetical protein